MSLLLDTLKNSITDRDEPQQLPVIISLFIARGLPIMLKPESHMYYHINRFLLQRPILFLEVK